MKFLYFILLLFSFTSSNAINNNPADGILGKWESTTNNLIVNVYKDHNDYKALVVWFKNTDEKNKPSDTWRDVKNPDKALRQRKLLGLEVLQHFVFNSSENRWEDGKIYDCTTGKTWNASAWIASNGLLQVRGYWHFDFLGQTMSFKKL